MKRFDGFMLGLTVVSATLTGCASYGTTKEPVEKSNLTMGMVKHSIIKGKTTQAEILQMFGAPNLVTKNRANHEVWNYNKMAFEAKTGQDSMTLILFGGSRAASTTTSKSFDLILEFDENDMVKDYSVISASF